MSRYRKSDWSDKGETPTKVQGIHSYTEVKGTSRRSRILFEMAAPNVGTSAIFGDADGGKETPVADQDMPTMNMDEYGYWEEESFSIDIKVCQPITDVKTRYFELPLCDIENVISRDVLQRAFKDAQYWRPASVEYELTDVKAKVIAKVDTTQVPIRIEEVNLARINTTTIGVADKLKIYDNITQWATFQKLLEQNYISLPDKLPLIQLYWNQFLLNYGSNLVTKDTVSRYELPQEHPLWITATHEDEKPVFSYKWEAKCKMLRAITEFWTARFVTYCGVPFAKMNNDSSYHSSYPTSFYMYQTNLGYQRFLQFDYRNGVMTNPGSGMWGPRQCMTGNHSDEIIKHFPVTVAPAITLQDGKMTGGMAFNVHPDPYSTHFMPHVTHDNSWVNQLPLKAKPPFWTDRRQGIPHDMPMLNAEKELMYDPAAHSVLFAGVTAFNSTSAGSTPFQSDQKIRPQYFKADLLYDGLQIIPYYLYFTVHLCYKVIVYRINSEDICRIGDDGAKDPVISYPAKEWGSAPIYTIGEQKDFRGPEDYYFINSNWRIYKPIDDMILTNIHKPIAWGQQHIYPPHLSQDEESSSVNTSDTKTTEKEKTSKKRKFSDPYMGKPVSW